MKRIRWQAAAICPAWITVLMMLASVPAGATEILGIDQPGTTHYSDWYGRISRVVPLEDESWCNCIYLNSGLNRCYVSHNSTSKSSIVELSLSPFQKIRNIQTPDNFGRIVYIDEIPSMAEFLVVSQSAELTHFLFYNMENNSVIKSNSISDKIQYPMIYLEYRNLFLAKSGFSNSTLVISDLLNFETNYIDFMQYTTNIVSISQNNSNDYFYIVTSDIPGKVLKININTINVEEFLTLSGYCSGLDSSYCDENLSVLALDNSLGKKCLINVNLTDFVVGDTIYFQEDESNINMAGTVGNYLIMSAKSNDYSKIMKFNVPEYTIETELLCDPIISEISRSKLDPSKLIVFDLSSPFKVV